MRQNTNTAACDQQPRVEQAAWLKENTETAAQRAKGKPDTASKGVPKAKSQSKKQKEDEQDEEDEPDHDEDEDDEK